jgi:hypothetical protein
MSLTLKGWQNVGLHWWVKEGFYPILRIDVFKGSGKRRKYKHSAWGLLDFST